MEKIRKFSQWVFNPEKKYQSDKQSLKEKKKENIVYFT